jgi:uncharacterized protein YdcH (DUF465 family)
MFPEYREQISMLKVHDAHFARLFDMHNDLDQKILNMEAGLDPATPLEIERLKKESCGSRTSSTPFCARRALDIDLTPRIRKP